MSNTQKRSNQDKFNFFVETELTKGKNEKGEDVIFIDGIASSSSVGDSDGETLYPTGYNTQPLLETGLINFNHQGNKDSNAVIGIPLEAKVINDGKDLYFKGMLWDCEQTRGVVRAYENFKKYSPNRKVGYSIEGKATMRGHTDKNHPLFKQVLAADVTGIAVTFSPKNKNTLMNIVKGEYSEAFIDEENEAGSINIEDLVDEYSQWTNKDSEFYGSEGNVKEFLENHHEDHMHLLNGLMNALNKAVSTETIAPGTPESVEHDKNFVSNKNSTNFGKELKKSEIYTSISRKYSTATIAEKKQIYNYVEQVNKKFYQMVVNTISQDALNKAFSLLDEANALVKSETTEIIDNTVAVAEDDILKSMETVSFIHNIGMDETASLDLIVKGGISEAIAKATWERVVAASKPAEETIVKSEDNAELLKSEIGKALEPVNDAIQKSIQGFTEVTRLLQEQNAQLIKSNQELALRLENVEKLPAGGRKSVTGAAALEKFAQQTTTPTLDENSYDITKSEDLERLADNITGYLEANYIQKGKAPDDFFNCMEGAVNSIEIAKTVPPFAYGRLAGMGFKLVKPTV